MSFTSKGIYVGSESRQTSCLAEVCGLPQEANNSNAPATHVRDFHIRPGILADRAYACTRANGRINSSTISRA